MNFEAMDEQIKQRLMAYLYGELSPAEKKQFEAELKDNEQLSAQLKAFQGTQSTLGKIASEEVVPPPFFQLIKEDKKPAHAAFKWVGSIAAAILILLIAGKFTGLTISSNQEGVQIAFGQANKAINPSDYVAKADVDQMIKSSLAAYDSQLNQQLETRAVKQEKLINEQFNQNRDLLASSVNSIQSENQRLLKNYWEQNTQQQQAYMTSLMGNFTNYVEQRRNEDMQYVLAKINLLETDTDLLELETNQIKNTYALNENNNTY